MSSTNDKNSRLYRQAVRLFDFPEINNIGLGYSKGRYGSRFGPVLAEKIISDAKEIIDAGNKDADLFQLILLVCLKNMKKKPRINSAFCYEFIHPPINCTPSQTPFL